MGIASPLVCDVHVGADGLHRQPKSWPAVAAPTDSVLPAGLTWLDLSHNRFTALPTALAGATSLRTLELVSRRKQALTRHDVDNTLLRMPHLHTRHQQRQHAPQRVQGAAPQPARTGGYRQEFLQRAGIRLGV